MKEGSEKVDLKQHSHNEAHGIWSHHFMGNRWETVETVSDFIFWAPRLLQMLIAALKLKDAYSLEEKLWPTSVQFRGYYEQLYAIKLDNLEILRNLKSLRNLQLNKTKSGWNRNSE